MKQLSIALCICAIAILTACGAPAVTPTSQPAPKQKIAATEEPTRAIVTAAPKIAPTQELTRLLATATQQRASPTSASTGALPLFDVHLHQVDKISASDLLALIKKAGFGGAVLLGPPNTDGANTVAAERAYPDFVFPFAYAVFSTRSDQQQVIASLESQLDKGRRGIGEISMRHASGANIPGNDYPADGPIALAVYELAAKRRVPVLIHHEFEYASEIENALKKNANVTLIWAHMGDGPSSLVRDMLKKYPNLYVDISSRNSTYHRRLSIEEQSITNSDGTIKGDWKSLFEDYSDRVLFGTDINMDKHTLTDQLADYYQKTFAQLLRATAEKIAYKNIRKLIGLP